MGSHIPDKHQMLPLTAAILHLATFAASKSPLQLQKITQR